MQETEGKGLKSEYGNKKYEYEKRAQLKKVLYLPSSACPEAVNELITNLSSIIHTLLRG